MSRVIEQDRIDEGDLTEDEVIYLAQRDRLPDAVRDKAEVVLRARKLLATSPPPLNDVPNTGDANTLRVTKEDLLALGLEVIEDGLNPPEQFENAALGDRAPGAADPTEGTAKPLSDEDDSAEDEDDERPYSEWSNRELAAEIAARNEDRAEEDKLPISKKAEMVEALEADDSEEE